MDLLETLAIITVFQLLFLSVHLATYKKGNKTSKRILISFLGANAVFIIFFLLYHSKILDYSRYPPLYYIGDAVYFLLGPLIFLYTKSLCSSHFTLQKRDTLHILPFAVLSLVPLTIYHLRLVRQSEISSSNTAVISRDFRTVFSQVVLILIFVYIVLSLVTLYRYRKKIKNYVSFTKRVNLSWLLWIILAFFFMWLLDETNMLLLSMNHRPLRIIFFLSVLSISVNLVFATGIVFIGLRQPNVFTGNEANMKYGTSKLGKDEMEHCVKRLNAVMEREKLYLDPQLTINDIAKRMALPVKHLSQAINEGHKKNFFDLISSYRIEEAKRLLSQKDNQEKTILEILYEAGFNSKSAFNRLFKQKTGVTPSEFRKHINY